jgi:hypothetical protein
VLFGLITISSVIFVSIRIYNNWELIRASTQSKPIVLMVMITGFVYFIIISILPATWQRLVSWISNKKTYYLDYYKIYGQTQIAKYLPGNIFHLVSRQVNADKLSVSQGSLILSSFLELLSYLLVATTICLVSYAFGFRFQLKIVNSLLLVFSGIIFVIIFLVLVFPQLLQKFNRGSQIAKFLKAQHSQPKLMLQTLIRVLFLVTAFFIMTSLLFSSLVFWVNNGNSKIYLLMLFPIYCLSYVVGLITPGAPAGFGVREVVMIVTLTPLIGNSEATLLALLFRMSTVIGDILLFISATLIKNLQKEG